MSNLRACLKFLMFGLACLIILPLQQLVLWLHKGRVARIVPYLWSHSVRLFFGIQVQTEGKAHTATQTLYISNHLSYLDIAVLGSLVKASFVARGDSATWPFLGWLTRLNQTAYVARSRSAAKQDANAVSSVIDSNRSLIIFPEGTSTDGQEILPFKSSLFSLALRDDKPDLHLQPITIQLLSADKQLPDTQEIRDVYAWHRDMDESIGMFDHWWGFAKHRGASIRVVFHPAIAAKDFDDRKTLAKACHDAVSNGVQNSNKLAA